MQRGTRSNMAMVACVALGLWSLATQHPRLQSPPTAATVSLGHQGCRSFVVPARHPRTRGRWVVHNGTAWFVTGGRAYNVPDYVDCPAAAPAVEREHRVRGRSSSFLPRPAKHRAGGPALEMVAPLPLDSLHPAVIQDVCHHPRALRWRKDVVPRWRKPGRVSPRHAGRWRQPGAASHDLPGAPHAGNRVCIVMRFFGGQLGGATLFNLETALLSLLAHPSSAAVNLVHTDASDVAGVHPILRRVNDSRVNLITFKDMQATRGWNHRTVWFATEKAIAMCPLSARWLLVTNGDNQYNSTVFDHLDDAYDITAFDFYSRHRPTWSRGECDAYSPRDGLTMGCLPNHLRLCETDLGAVVVNLPRWRREGRRFSAHTSDNGSEDGLLYESLVRDGWLHQRISGAATGECLFDHNPNYHSCVRASNATVWDDGAQTCLDTRNHGDALQASLKRGGRAERCLY